MLIEENYNLKKLNTFAISAKANFYASFSNTDELIELLQICKKNNQIPFVLGGGSNMLLTKDLDAFVLKNELVGIEIIEESLAHVIVEVGGGEVWHNFVLRCIDNDWGGVENLSLIPGSVGAAPIQNIGAYGVELKDCFESLDALNKETLELETFSAKDCGFAYRDSVFKGKFKNQYVITSVQFRLSKTPDLKTSYGAIQDELKKMGSDTNPTIVDVSNAIITIRKSKLPNPAEIGNSGSFFKNPIIDFSVFESLIAQHPDILNYPLENGKVKLAAGWLIEKAGWKGKQVGDAGMHSKQALVLVNYGKATGAELLAVSKQVQADVYQMFKISLEAEVNIL